MPVHIRRSLAAFLVLLVAALAPMAPASANQVLLYEIQPLIARYAPHVHPQTLTAIIDVESSGWPWTIHDNVTGRSFYLPTYIGAVRLARRLIDLGHNPDLGIAQINAGNLSNLHLRVEEVFIPQDNIWAAGRILTQDYQAVVNRYGAAWVNEHPLEAVRMATSAYNTGSLYAGKDYVSKVVAHAIALESMFQRPVMPTVNVTYHPVKVAAPRANAPMIVPMLPFATQTISVTASIRKSNGKPKGKGK